MKEPEKKKKKSTIIVFIHKIFSNLKINLNINQQLYYRIESK